MADTGALNQQTLKEDFRTFLVKGGVNEIVCNASGSYDSTVENIRKIFAASEQMVPVYEDTLGPNGEKIQKTDEHGNLMFEPKGLSQKELMEVQLMLLDAQQMLQMAKTVMGYEKSALNQATQAIQAA